MHRYQYSLHSLSSVHNTQFLFSISTECYNLTCVGLMHPFSALYTHLVIFRFQLVQFTVLVFRFEFNFAQCSLHLLGAISNFVTHHLPILDFEHQIKMFEFWVLIRTIYLRNAAFFPESSHFTSNKHSTIQ